MNHFFAYINRTKYIRRWGLMRNTEEESLSEHLYQTSILAHALAVIDRTIFGGDCDEGRVTLAALYHDAGEIITGDLPTPIKYYNDDIKRAYHKIEDETCEMLLSKLPAELRDSYADILTCSTLTEHERRIVKAADTLGAYIKCLEEKKAGNRDFDGAATSTEKKLDEFNLPCLDYFRREFLSSYNLTIDEMR